MKLLFFRKMSLVSLSILLLAAAIVTGGGAHASAAGSEAKGSLIIVNKTTNELAYFKDGDLLRIFPVATGKTDDLTPEGVFPIVNKIKDRPYYKEKIPGGDPANPLGRRWLGLHVGNTYGTTYAIHGNNNEKSIGKYVSAGCIRMHNKDIEWLFEQLPLHTKVIVTSSELTFEEIAAEHHFEVLQPFQASLAVNGEAVPLERRLFLYRDVTFIPLRECIELLGGIVVWDAATKEITISVGEHTIIHQPGSSEAIVDGKAVTLRSASRNRNGVTMIPLREMASLTGWTVHWESAERTIFVEL